MADDAVKVAPHVYTVISENDRVRLLDVRIQPGESTTMHRHPAMVAVGLTDGKYKFSFPGGQSMEVELKAGESMYLDAVDHATENTGGTEGHAILIELK